VLHTIYAVCVCDDRHAAALLPALLSSRTRRSSDLISAAMRCASACDLMPKPTILEFRTTLFCTRLIKRYTECATSSPSRVPVTPDRKSTRLNSSHVSISYAVSYLKKQYLHAVLSSH